MKKINLLINENNKIDIPSKFKYFYIQLFVQL